MRPTARILLAILLVLAGCASPTTPSGATTPGATPTSPPATSAPPASSTPSAGASAPTPAPASPEVVTSPTSPAAPAGPPYTGLWEHDHSAGARTLSIHVAPGSGPTPVLLGFHPRFDALRRQCDGPDATIALTSPSGARLASVRAGDRPIEGAGCPSAVRMVDVDFTPGIWQISFEGQGDIVGFVASGERAGETGVAYRISTLHDYTYPENSTLLSVPANGGAVDLTLKLDARAPGQPCPGDSIRAILHDPRGEIFTRLDFPANPLPSECSRSQVERNVMLAPGTWTLRWGGAGEVLGSVLIEPTAGV